jgi:hypothetical protein
MDEGVRSAGHVALVAALMSFSLAGAAAQVAEAPVGTWQIADSMSKRREYAGGVRGAPSFPRAPSAVPQSLCSSASWEPQIAKYQLIASILLVLCLFFTYLVVKNMPIANIVWSGKNLGLFVWNTS